MKTFRFILAASLFLISASYSYCQDNSCTRTTSCVMDINKESYEVICDSITTDISDQVSVFFKVKSFRSAMVEFENTEKIIFDQKANKVTIIGCRKYSIHGEVVFDLSRQNQNTIEYIPGESSLTLK
jgi:hypothetical protein